MAKDSTYFSLNNKTTKVSDLKKQLQETFSLMEHKDADKVIKQPLGKYGREAKKVAGANARSAISTHRGKTPVGSNINKLLKASVKRTKSDKSQYWSRVKANPRKANIDFAPNGSKELIELSSRNIHWWEGGTKTGIKATHFMRDAYKSTEKSGVNAFKTILNEYVQKRMEKLSSN
ncbi:MAG: hypothetical protein PF444_02050 [Bacteroidales bacterium]|jgi:hypothetical protein|nr:hypothetical protein [Bacteroidales bacterium]